MIKKAIFPGSFDPITIGHIEIIEKSLRIFDEVIIAIGTNPDKKYMFSKNQRLNFIVNYFDKKEKVKVVTYDELTYKLCKRLDVKYIARGVRNILDFEYEKNMAEFNRNMGNIETIIITCSNKYSHISSSLVRDLIKNKSDFKHLVPNSVKLNL
ncbi:MAG: pantetheine-phosphate adenylyltransferase [Flavobacteriaceae bacterium]